MAVSGCCPLFCSQLSPLSTCMSLRPKMLTSIILTSSSLRSRQSSTWSSRSLSPMFHVLQPHLIEYKWLRIALEPREDLLMTEHGYFLLRDFCLNVTKRVVRKDTFSCSTTCWCGALLSRRTLITSVRELFHWNVSRWRILHIQTRGRWSRQVCWNDETWIISQSSRVLTIHLFVFSLAEASSQLDCIVCWLFCYIIRHIYYSCPKDLSLLHEKLEISYQHLHF